MRKFFIENKLNCPRYLETIEPILYDYGMVMIQTFDTIAMLFIPKEMTEKQYEILEQYNSFLNQFEYLELGIYEEEIHYYDGDTSLDKSLLPTFYAIIKERVERSTHYESR